MIKIQKSRLGCENDLSSDQVELPHNERICEAFVGFPVLAGTRRFGNSLIFRTMFRRGLTKVCKGLWKEPQKEVNTRE